MLSVIGGMFEAFLTVLEMLLLLLERTWEPTSDKKREKHVHSCTSSIIFNKQKVKQKAQQTIKMTTVLIKYPYSS